MAQITAEMGYTISDHEIRDGDKYANSKYDLTEKWLLPHFGPNPEKKLLFNIGCGSGIFNLRARKHGLQVVGIEPEAKTFELAKVKCSPHGVELLHTGLFELDSNRKADFIVMHDVLEHIPDDASAAKKLASLVKPGGRVVLSVPAMQSLFGSHDESLGHYRRYSKESLQRVLEPHFKIHKLRYFGFLFIPIVWWFSVFKRKDYPHAGSQQGIGALIMDSICGFEKAVPLGLGTSLIVELEPK